MSDVGGDEQVLDWSLVSFKDRPQSLRFSTGFGRSWAKSYRVYRLTDDGPGASAIHQDDGHDALLGLESNRLNLFICEGQRSETRFYHIQ